MNRGHWLPVWRQVAADAERASDQSVKDIAACMSAAMMVDALEHGRPIPNPTPELNARLAHAEVLAKRA